MRGHVRKRGKSWCYVIDVGCDPVTKKRRQRWQSGFATRKAAEEAQRKALHLIDVGDDPIPEKVTLHAFAARWFDHLAAQGHPRPRVRAAYERHMRSHVLPNIGGMELRKVRSAHCQRVLDAYADGRAPRSVAHLRAAMSSMFNAALQWGLVTMNPVRATKTPTPQQPKLVTPSAEQLRALIEAAVGTTWELPVLLAATTGARRAEVLGLTWTHVDLDRGRLRIVETLQRVDGSLTFTPPKTDRARREIPLPGFAVEALRQHRRDQASRRLAFGAGWADDPDDLVCERGDGQPLDPDAFTHGFARIAKAAGFGGVRLHDLRHGVATILAKTGTPPYVTSKLLGHSSVHFTANTYQHADEESVGRALAGLEEAFGR